MKTGLSELERAFSDRYARVYDPAANAKAEEERRTEQERKDRLSRLFEPAKG